MTDKYTKTFWPFEVSDTYCWDNHRTLRIAERIVLPWPFPLAYGLGGSSAMVLGYKIYGRNAPRAIKRLHRHLRRLQEAKYWVMYRTIRRHQYHVVRTDLEPGYYDDDTRMLHACMGLLCNHVEQGHGGEEALAKFTADLSNPAKQDKNAPAGWEDAQASRQSEALTIYVWWKRERPADRKRRDELLHELYGNRRMRFKPVPGNDKLQEYVPSQFTAAEAVKEKEFRALERKIDRDEQAMLHRLVTIRRSLWT